MKRSRCRKGSSRGVQLVLETLRRGLASVSETKPIGKRGRVGTARRGSVAGLGLACVFSKDGSGSNSKALVPNMENR